MIVHDPLSTDSSASSPVSRRASSPAAFASVAEAWRKDPFFADDAVVLGIDIGIEGIGIALRRGQQFLFCKTLLVELPEAAALAGRRAYRAARHARKNRRLRLRRLKSLFERHGLPWVSDDVMSRSDPFLLRQRAITKKLASKEALSICIRSVLERRGYDYFAMSGQEGELPWGDSYKLADARKWLSSAYVDEELRRRLRTLAPQLLKTNKELSPKDEQAWYALIEERFAQAEQLGIPAMLEAYAHKHLNERKARGFNYPRAHVEDHLRCILNRHQELIEDYEAFVERLFLPCDTKEHKAKAIFNYNRKTPDEAGRHFHKKVKDCPYCALLDLPPQKCSSNGDPEIRLWKALDFCSNRRLDMQEKKAAPERRLLSGAALQALMAALQKNLSWADCKKAMETALKPLCLVPAAKSEWNKMLLEQLKDICAPQGSKKAGRASMSDSAARQLIRLATDEGRCVEPAAVEAWKKEWKFYEKRDVISSQGGIYPQVRALLGCLGRAETDGKAHFAVKGLLQRLFKRDLAPLLGGKTAPDYCVIECVRNAAPNKTLKKDIEKEQKMNREKIDKQIAEFGGDPKKTNQRYRLALFKQQGGSAKTPAICPFTGQSLGCNPFDEKLELAHLYPDSRGGFYMMDNLVLCTREVNKAMNNDTPREAARRGLPSWLSWEEMLRQSRSFRWGEAKRKLFAFEPTESERFPDFGNMTRTAQLARELRNLVAYWMGIADDREACRLRIGNPSGQHTAAARRSLLGEYEKDRDTYIHHRYDAAVMCCIPPSGLNSALYGGVFCNVLEAGDGSRRYRNLYLIEGLPAPNFEALMKDGSTCPIIKQRSRSKCKSLGDSTFWSCGPDGQTKQRSSLDISDKTNAAQLYQMLAKMGIPSKEIPSEKQLEEWLIERQAATKADADKPAPELKLRNGSPVRHLYKYGSKGNLDKSPLGWNGILQENGKFDQLRSLNGTNERLELWLGWNAKKKRWDYYKRVIPTKAAMEGLKRLGLPWRGTKNAPEYLLRLLEQRKAKDLKTLLCGTLPPHSLRVGQFRKGDVFNLKFAFEEEAIKDGVTHVQTWGYVSAVNSDGVLKTKSLLYKKTKVCCKSTGADLALMLHLPSAEELAQLKGLTPPA